MILIVGGRNQGKEAFARQLLAGQEAGGTDGWLVSLVDGRTDFWVSAVGARCILNIHEMLRQMAAEGINTDDFLRLLLRQPPQVITMDEVGCGIVPVDAGERRYRELCGMAGQTLAAQADTVIRMVCGIPMYIRGTSETMCAGSSDLQEENSDGQTGANQRK
ncbi:MAG: bifunctional adenosylcobinamide kinase/adenosylcobinamide-phosphate guanylyltransferase [Clostridiales bacterium]|nr:bifunctional adenosylcobinamide kinase/adenosylcobinamide-phosphate guanylyltransferase [Clostridiales bacterium]